MPFDEDAAGDATVTVWLVWLWAWGRSGNRWEYLEAIVATRTEANRVQRRLRDEWNRKLQKWRIDGYPHPHPDNFVDFSTWTEKRVVQGR